MYTIESLNSKYEEITRSIEAVHSCGNRVYQEQHNSNISSEYKAVRSVECLKELLNTIGRDENSLLTDTYDLGLAYKDCIESIADYRKAFNDILQGGTVSVSGFIDNIKKKYEIFNRLKVSYGETTRKEIRTVEDINKLIEECLGHILYQLNNVAETCRTDAKRIIDGEKSVFLSIDDAIEDNQDLPKEIQIARIPMEGTQCSVLRDIGKSNSYRSINIDIQSRGNILIRTDYKQKGDIAIDHFVIAYILHFINSFPLGSVNVHVFGQNLNYLYKRISNSFQSEELGEATDHVIQLQDNVSDLRKLRDINCEDIFKKTSVGKPDLYSLYENDRTDPFNLVILRDGLVDARGYTSSDNIDLINSLTSPGDVGHKCGLRFVIVDSSSSYEKSHSESDKYVLEQIRGNCEVQIDYDKEQFSLSGTQLEVLQIKDDVDTFVEERSMLIASAISNREKNYVSLNDITESNYPVEPSNTLYIPVGKSGESTVLLPFSCSDIDGTVAGRCVGYMVIGQSGSGKSSFFHSIVMSGCKKYAPEDLQFWLLDFKNGGASSRYTDSGLPHIRIIAENNRIDDALCLFQMILEEMDRRISIYKKHGFFDIYEYNKKAKEEGLEYFPRIIIAIDEVQEIFRDDNASALREQISSISTRMRSSGMHFILVAQNLSDGKSYMLKDSFLDHVTGRVCFRVAPDIPGEAAFGEDFIQRKREIADLKTGEAYISYGKDTIKRVKIAYTTPQEMSETIFPEIRDQYAESAEKKPLIIGSKQRLSICSFRQGTIEKYYDILRQTTMTTDGSTAVIGEDVYRMSPLRISFSQNENSSLLLLGSNRQIASSLCASTAVSLMRQDVEVHLFNGDRNKIRCGEETLPHSFMSICQEIKDDCTLIHHHRLDEMKFVLGDLYTEYQKRQEVLQAVDNDIPIFSPLFLLVNDLFAVESFVSDENIKNRAEINQKQDDAGQMGIRGYDRITSTKTEKRMQEVMGVLLRNGYRYNIHVVLAITGDPGSWRRADIVSDAKNVVFFNQTDYAAQTENSYYLKEMLKNIANDDGEETVAVLYRNRSYSKIRPIIYDMSNKEEAEMLRELIRKG